jgi:hypothetical protein
MIVGSPNRVCNVKSLPNVILVQQGLQLQSPAKYLKHKKTENCQS